MKENKVELTDEEKEEVYKKLINYICNYNEGNENEDNKKFLEDISKNEKHNKNAWWEEKKDGKIYYNQKAHIVMHILSKNNNNREEPLDDVQNKGFIYLLYFLIKGQKKEYEGKNWLKTYWENYANDINKKINKLKNEKNDLLKENINTLLDYVELYFSKENNFKDIDDYQKFNEPILNNLYNWYLKDITNPDEINTYCNKLENIVNNMEKLLVENSENAYHIYNLICTIYKTKDIITNLKMRYYKKKNRIINKSLNDFIAKCNPLK